MSRPSPDFFQPHEAEAGAWEPQAAAGLAGSRVISGLWIAIAAWTAAFVVILVAVLIVRH